MNEKLDRICAVTVAARPVLDPPPWFATRVMAHVRERAEAAMERWFVRRVGLPLMAGGGALSAGCALGLAWLWYAGAITELTMLLAGGSFLDF